MMQNCNYLLQYATMRAKTSIWSRLNWRIESTWSLLLLICPFQDNIKTSFLEQSCLLQFVILESFSWCEMLFDSSFHGCIFTWVQCTLIKVLICLIMELDRIEFRLLNQGHLLWNLHYLCLLRVKLQLNEVSLLQVWCFGVDRGECMISIHNWTEQEASWKILRYEQRFQDFHSRISNSKTSLFMPEQSVYHSPKHLCSGK